MFSSCTWAQINQIIITKKNLHQKMCQLCTWSQTNIEFDYYSYGSYSFSIYLRSVSGKQCQSIPTNSSHHWRLDGNSLSTSSHSSFILFTVSRSLLLFVHFYVFVLLLTNSCFVVLFFLTYSMFIDFITHSLKVNEEYCTFNSEEISWSDDNIVVKA